MTETRPRDLLYDAWVETWGEPQTSSERGRLNRALKELREIDATPEQVRHALDAYPKLFPGMTRSPQGVTGNWTALLARRPPPARSAGPETCQHGVSFWNRCARCLEDTP